MKKLLSLVAALILFSSCQTDNKVEFIVLQLNDVYEIASLEGGKVAGMARVSTLRNQLLQENPNVITTLSGDFVSPSLIGTLKYEGERIAGRHMVEVMNALGVDYVVPGNHEYDISEEEHLKRIAESEFIWTTTNCFRMVDGQKVNWMQNGKPLPDHVMHRIEGVDIAFFGSTVPFNKASYVTYTDKYESVKNVYEMVKDEAEVFIGITHLEEYMDDSLATYMVPEFDLILGGHDHANMIHDFGGVRMTKADANAKTVYVHRISYDKISQATTIESELVEINESLEDDPKVKAVVEKWEQIASKSMKSMGYEAEKVVFTTDLVLDGRESSIRYKPTNYPIMTAESFLFAVPDADLEVFNSGSIRLDDQLTGTITEYDILRSFPFGGGISVVDLKGNEVEEILEIGTVKNVGIGGYLQIANAKKTNGSWMIKDKPLNKNQTYKMVLPTFVMNGREKNLEFLSNNAADSSSPENFNGIQNDVRDIIMAYFRQL